MGIVNKSISHEVCLFEANFSEHSLSLERKVESKNMATSNLVTNNYRENQVPSPKPVRLTPQQMDVGREKGLCFNYDNNYSKEPKYSEKKLFYMDYEEEGDQ